jgi:hypothetical protein
MLRKRRALKSFIHPKGVKVLIGWLRAISLPLLVLSPLFLFSKTVYQTSFLQRNPQSYSTEENSFFQTQQNFAGLTPLSPSVWNTYHEEIQSETDLDRYILREAYLLEADRKVTQKESRMFSIPLDDLSSTQRRILSPFRREEEERQRRDYAESVSIIAANKGLPEYVIQVLGFQKLREGMKKVERAVALDATLSTTKVTNDDGSLKKDLRPWRYRGTLLVFQRSYRMGITNSIWSFNLQGGDASAKGDKLYAEISARWSRYVQSNTFQFLTTTAISSFSYFFQDDFSVSFSYLNELKNQPSTPDVNKQTLGFNYIF